MKKTRVTWLVASIAGVFCLSAMAAELKVGYVNAGKILDEAPQAKTAAVKLEQEFGNRKEQLLAAEKEVTAQEEKLARDGAVMSEAQRRKLEREMIANKRELRRSQDEFREDLAMRRNEEVGKIQLSVKHIIEEMGKRENYDLILFDGIAFANPQLDLTEKILERLRSEPEKDKVAPKQKK